MNEMQKELKNSIGKFCLNQIEPHMEHDDANSEFRKSIFNELGQMGLTGITTSDQYGGAGLTCEDMCVVLEEIAKYSVSYAVTISVSTMVQSIIEMFGSKEQKKNTFQLWQVEKELELFVYLNLTQEVMQLP